ncbi:MAG TPA: TIGR03000 domain-containing protein, partial [Gemmataceae bacterium]|nr:TIGR03000 domain-containing protein [Gemmataceae bacterium]
HPGGGHPGGSMGAHPGGVHVGGPVGVHPGGPVGVHPGGPGGFHHVGAFPGGYYHHPYYPHYGGFGYSPFIGLGYGYPFYGGFGLGYGYGLGYGGYYGSGYYGGYDPGYVRPGVAIPADYTTPYQVQPVYPAAAPAVTGDPAPATLTVVVPDGAQLWFNGTASDQAGNRQTFTTAAINPGTTQTVQVKMVNAGGSPVQLPLHLRAGDKITVDLTSLR